VPSDPAAVPVEGTGEYSPTEADADAPPRRPALEGTLDLSAPPPDASATPTPDVPPAPVDGTLDHDPEKPTADFTPPAAPPPDASPPGTADYNPEAPTADFPQPAAVPQGTSEYDPHAPTADPPFVIGSGKHDASAFAPTADPTPSVGHARPSGRLPAGPRFDLKKVHAKGGMGEVWLAEDAAIGRRVALKKMRKQLKGKGKEENFLWEAQVTGQLEHPGIVPVHELGESGEGDPYYVMKFVHGSTMLEEIGAFHALPAGDPRRRVERLRLLQVFLQLCQTIAFAHHKGVIHRDIKPENVMIGEYGETLVLDWGLAKLIGAAERAEKDDTAVRRSYSGESLETIAGSIKGTPWYMAPEVAAGNVRAVDQLSDVFLLGATLYHLITGQKPREGKTLPELITAAHKPPIPPRQHDPTIPKPLEAICLKAMAVDRAARYPSAKALAEDLEHFLAGEPVTAYRETFTERAWRWAKRHRVVIGRTVIGVIVLTAAGLGWAEFERRERVRENERQEEAAKLKATEDARVQAENEARELQQRNEAKAKLAQFRKLAEEARFLVASTNPVAAQAPFFNARAGLAKGEEALALAAPWGDDLAAFPLADDRPALAKDVADLLLLMAQVKSLSPGKDAGQATLALLDRAARLQPPTRSAHRLRAAALAAVGRPAEAAPEAAKADDPGTPLTAADHFLLGEQARVPVTRPEGLRDRSGKFRPDPVALEKAIEQYRLALRADPSHYWSHFQLGRCLLSLGRAEEGVQALAACVALRKDSPWGYSARGVALTTLKRFDDAAADLNRAIELDPGSRLLLMNRGVLEWLRGDTKPALADFDAALADPPEQAIPEAAFYKAQLFNQEGDLDQALTAADRALEGKNPVRPAYLFRAQVRLLQGRENDGIDDLNGFLAADDPAFDPRSAAAAAQRGRQLFLIAQELPPTSQRKQLLLRKQILLLARTQLRDAERRGGATDVTFEYLGRVCQRLNQPTDAIEAYTRALELAPKDVRTLALRGWAYFDLPDPPHDKAGADFEAALRLSPDDPEAHAGLGYVQACRKKGVEARREAQRAALYGPGDFMQLHNVACVFARLSADDAGRRREFEDLALDYLRRAVELWKRDRSGPNELDLIARESAFTGSMKARPEFKKLFE
jgi:tetratricopeptide (TPR) repeat protein/tRNA A-37 threonylcarbamoyl transferase component Bud32